MADFDMEAASAAVSDGLFGDSDAGGGDVTDVVPKREVVEEEVNLEVPGEEAAAAAVDKPAEPAKPAPTDPAATTAASTPVTAPKTWRPEAAVTWATIPPAAQEEILKREADMFKGLESYKGDAQVGKALSQAVAPYQGLLATLGVDPIAATSQLMRMQAILMQGTPQQKQMLVQKVIQDYGIQFEAPASGEAPYVDPQVAALQQKIAALESNTQAQTQRQEQLVREQLSAELNAFASDPANPDFDLLVDDIAQLIKGGIAKDLREAYDKAAKLNPIVAEKVLARKTAEATAKAQEEAAKAAKAKASTIRSAPKSSGGTASLGSLDETLAAALADIKGR